ncbi:MAG: tRNA (adenosine(37)-N6)-dimethylallyltransferase MiaA [Candidatus Pacebacteria bacterium]|nr:tRNA (adenosine(37)-N6)-dimethylallyltransferase MiaA [Candidatus Paceibacterota bacterium]
MKSKVIVIVGPTASGKSSLGIFLAKKLKGEVISADSRQVYKGLDIGTGKVTKKEMSGVPHHLLSVASPKKQFSADDFVKQGTKILSKTNLPIVVGGTGFYVDALLGRMVLPNVPPNPKLRARLEKMSVEALYKLLTTKDPARAKTIEPKHKRRIIRALEIAEHTLRQTTPARALRAARPSPTLASSSLASQKYEVLWLGINPTPEVLKKNIHNRLLVRLKQGMKREAKKLHKAGVSYKRMEELGLEYRYLARLLQNKLTKEEFLEQLEREINKYAKRQWRWFKRNKDIHWVTNKTKALQLAKAFISG